MARKLCKITIKSTSKIYFLSTSKFVIIAMATKQIKIETEINFNGFTIICVVFGRYLLAVIPKISGMPKINAMTLINS